MSRNPKNGNPEASTATIDKPKRQRKSPEERTAARLTRLNKRIARIVTLIHDLSDLTLTEKQERYIEDTVGGEMISVGAAWAEARKRSQEEPRQIEIRVPEE